MNSLLEQIKGVASHLLETDGVPPPEVLQLFALGDGDCCLHHFNCALVSRVLLQGKLYVYPSRVCFFSRFNVQTLVGARPTVVVLPYAQVKCVKAQRGKTFDNSLVIEMMDGQNAHVFTSFLQRDRAVRAIHCVLEQAKEGLMESLWFQEALKLIDEVERREKQREEDAEYDEIGLDSVQREAPQHSENLAEMKQSWLKLKDAPEFRHNYEQLFAERRTRVHGIMAQHEKEAGTNLKWLSVFLPQVSVSEIFCLIFGNKTFTHAQTGKQYASFLHFYMQESLKESNIVVSQIEPPTPEFFDSPYSENRLQLVDAPLTSKRTFQFTHPLPKMLFMPDSCSARIEECLYWVSDEEILLERFMNVTGVSVAETFEARVFFRLNAGRSDAQEGVEVACASYLYFKKSTVLKGTIESSEREQFQKCWTTLKKLLIDETARYCAQRDAERAKKESEQRALLMDSVQNQQFVEGAQVQSQQESEKAQNGKQQVEEDDEEWQEVPLEQQLEQVGEAIKASQAACVIF